MNYPNETLKTILQRKSIRRFKTKNVPRQVVEQILAAGQRAPSSCNLQTYSLIQIEKPETRKKLTGIIKGQSFIKNAPVWIVICSDRRRLTRMLDHLRIDHCFKHGYGLTETLYSIFDSGLVAENMVLATESLGLGSVFIGDILVYAEKVSEILRIPETAIPLVLLCIGYPEEDPPLRPRWPLESVASKDHYREVSEREVETYLKLFYKQSEKEHENKPPEEVREEFIKDIKKHMDPERHREHDPRFAEYLRTRGILPKY